MALIETFPAAGRPVAPGRCRPDRADRLGARPELAIARYAPVCSRPSRPTRTGLRHRATAQPMSQPHQGQRPAGVATTIGLALLAGVITVWLGAVAQLGAAAAGSTSVGFDEPITARVEAGQMPQDAAAGLAPVMPRGPVGDGSGDRDRLGAVPPGTVQTGPGPIG